MSGTSGLLAYGYLRLSQEEALAGESSSITNQRQYISDYCDKNGIRLLRTFADDGWSGGNFRRPGFQEMMDALGSEEEIAGILGHEIGHTLGLLPAGAQLGPVGNAAMTLYKAMEREWKRQISETRQVGDAAKNVKGEITRLIAWWHGQDKMPDYYRKPNEMFAELFGIFLTQPESVQAAAPHAYDACVKIIAGNDKLAAV